MLAGEKGGWREDRYHKTGYRWDRIGIAMGRTIPEPWSIGLGVWGHDQSGPNTQTFL